MRKLEVHKNNNRFPMDQKSTGKEPVESLSPLESANYKLFDISTLQKESDIEERDQLSRMLKKKFKEDAVKTDKFVEETQKKDI